MLAIIEVALTAKLRLLLNNEKQGNSRTIIIIVSKIAIKAT